MAGIGTDRSHAASRALSQLEKIKETTSGLDDALSTWEWDEDEGEREDAKNEMESLVGELASYADSFMAEIERGE